MRERERERWKTRERGKEREREEVSRAYGEMATMHSLNEVCTDESKKHSLVA